jgi:integrase
VNRGLLKTNPWREVKVLAKVRRAAPTQAYQAENIISALVSRVDAQAVFGLACFLGLRPSEIAGLQWGDIEGHWPHIRRAAVRGRVDETKTPGSLASLPLLQPVKGMLELWRRTSAGKVSDVTSARSHVDPAGVAHVGREDWVFPTKGGPLNIESFCFHVVRPPAASEGRGRVVWALCRTTRGCNPSDSG